MTEEEMELLDAAEEQSPAKWARDDAPIGTIMAFAGPSSVYPDGWLVCDGSQFTYDYYPTLSGVLQDYWGPANVPLKQYTLPNLQGLFLRGVNGARNDKYADPDAQNNRQFTHPGGSNQVGSLQPDAFQGHYHRLGYEHSIPYGGPNNTKGDDERNGFYNNSVSVLEATEGGFGAPRVSKETRPVNAYVIYMIKARPKDPQL